MDSKLKYTEGVFEIDEKFLEGLEEIDEAYIDNILDQMHSLCIDLEDQYNEVQSFAGVSHIKGQLFFLVSVLKEKNKNPYFFKLEVISSDDYLDFMLDGYTI